MGQGDGLAAVLIGGHLGNDLGGNVAGSGEGMGLLNEGAGNNSAVLEHIVQIHQVAIVHMLGIVIGVMEMDDARLMGRHDLPGQQNAAGDILGHLACHIVPLDGIDGGVLVCVLLLDLLVVAFDEAQDAVVCGVGLAGQVPGIAVSDILFRHLKSTVGHDGLLHQVLDLFNGRAAAHFLAGNGDALGNAADLNRRQAHFFLNGIVGLGNSLIDFFNIKNDFCAVSLDDLHRAVLLVFFLFVASLYYILWFCQVPTTKCCGCAFDEE